ncbi:rhodanese-like domain-containing protein [Chryseolinea sp. H1M3-3]|uniref:rhodanese-like domain-containing protein n=1 Tax=Chryseolinea sp. H1M3-3 TaxID=3034144 RepID=UPI0023EC5BFA|nr:rhodanese-like domain-containing protein [Chryseolinea sp. H1M3-3]
MEQKLKLIYVFVGLIFCLTSCTTGGKNENGDSADGHTVVLEPQDFKSKLSATPNAVLIDVRTPEEVSEGVIEGAINIDFKDPGFSDKINALDKEKPYYVYCLSGKRSNDAVKIMEEKGFKNVYTLKDGLNNWTEAGLEVVKP